MLSLTRIQSQLAALIASLRCYHWNALAEKKSIRCSNLGALSCMELHSSVACMQYFRCCWFDMYAQKQYLRYLIEIITCRSSEKVARMKLLMYNCFNRAPWLVGMFRRSHSYQVSLAQAFRSWNFDTDEQMQSFSWSFLDAFAHKHLVRCSCLSAVAYIQSLRHVPMIAVI